MNNNNYNYKFGLLCWSIILISILSPVNFNAATESDDQLNVTIKNQQIEGTVKIKVVDSDKKPISGVGYTIYDSEMNKISSVVTNTSGVAQHSNLPYGDYYVQETSVPTGYLSSDKRYQFNIIENDKTVEINNSKSLVIEEDKNQEQGFLRITSLNGVGDVYYLYDEDGNLIDTLVVGDDGTVESGALDYGEYVLVGPDGEYHFEISKKNIIEEYQIFDENTPPSAASKKDNKSRLNQNLNQLTSTDAQNNQTTDSQELDENTKQDNDKTNQQDTSSSIDNNSEDEYFESEFYNFIPHSLVLILIVPLLFIICIIIIKYRRNNGQ